MVWIMVAAFYLGGFGSATLLALHGHPWLALFALVVVGSFSVKHRS